MSDFTYYCCHKEYKSNEMTYTLKENGEDLDKLVCEDCLYKHFKQCETCGDWFEPQSLITTKYGALICKSCNDKE